MDLGLEGKRVVVSGGSAGIGAEIVRAFAREGCLVHFCARNSDRIAALSSAINSVANDSRGQVSGAVIDVGGRTGYR